MWLNGTAVDCQPPTCCSVLQMGWAFLAGLVQGPWMAGSMGRTSCPGTSTLTSGAHPAFLSSLQLARSHGAFIIAEGCSLPAHLGTKAANSCCHQEDSTPLSGRCCHLWGFVTSLEPALRLFCRRLMTTDLAWLWDTHHGQVAPLDPDGRYLLRINKHFILPSPLKNNVIDARVVSTSTGEPLGIPQQMWQRMCCCGAELSCASASQPVKSHLLSRTGF